MEFTEVAKVHISTGGDSFGNAIKVWMRKPQVVSRRLCGCVPFETNLLPSAPVEKRIKLSIGEQGKFSTDWKHTLSPTDWKGTEFCINDHTSTLPEGMSNSEHVDIIDKILPQCLSYVEDLCRVAMPGDNFGENEEDVREECAIRYHVRKLLPRQLDKFKALMEIIILCDCGDKLQYYIFVPLQLRMINENIKDVRQYFGTYGFKYVSSDKDRGGSIHLLVNKESIISNDSLSGTLMASPQWLEKSLLPKLKVWAEEDRVDNDMDVAKLPATLGSLHLISLERYNELYNALKAKYSDYLIKIWPENTDPLKFIFEDIGIAAYLILTWRRLNQSKSITFVDVGCGNGLLVYLLNQEGYKGKGIDVRRRKIWDVFGDHADLQEITLFPNEMVFQFDWMIGNHSDELTPWIPIIAARSCANYFNLPCCFFTFQGKFQRNKNFGTQYRQYLDFIGDIGRKCNYRVEEDKLRIPSTKKICQIGIRQTGNTFDANGDKDRFLKELLDSFGCTAELGKATIISPSTVSSDVPCEDLDSSDQSDFVPRKAQIPVKNCTKIDVNLRNAIVSKVFETVLNSTPKEDTTFERTGVTSKGYPSSAWNTGGSVPLQDVVGLFDSSCLSELKAQCGGIKTLLKNHSHIFKVIQGKVSLRCYAEVKATPSKKSYRQSKSASRKETFRKTKQCWFDLHHPQGCLLTTTECDFLHEEESIKNA